MLLRLGPICKATLPVLCWGVYMLTYHPVFFPDEVAQLAAARSFLQGNGLTVPTLNLDGPELIEMSSLYQFPAGCPLLYASVLALRFDPLIGLSVIQLIAAAWYCFAWWDILTLLQREGMLSNRTVIVFWLIWIVVWCPLECMRVSDQIAATFFTLSLGALFRAASGGNRSWAYALAAQLFVLLSCFTRFAYYPVLVVGPVAVFLLAASHSKLRKPLLMSGLVSGVFGACGLFALTIIQQCNTGHATYLSNYYPQWKFHPEHLLRINPVFSSAIGFSAFLDKFPLMFPKLQRLIPNLQLLCSTLGHLLSLLLAGWTCRLIWSFVRPGWRNRVATVPGTVILLISSTATFCLTVAMLCYLSVRTDYETWLPGGWTHVMETRYYASVFPLVTLLVASTLASIRLDWSSVGAGRCSMIAILASLLMLSLLDRAWSGYCELTGRWSTRAARAIAITDGRAFQDMLTEVSSPSTIVLLVPDPTRFPPASRFWVPANIVCITREQMAALFTTTRSEDCLLLVELSSELIVPLGVPSYSVIDSPVRLTLSNGNVIRSIRLPANGLPRDNPSLP